MTPAAKRRKEAASAKKLAKEERKGQIDEIGKKRHAMEQAKVGYPFWVGGKEGWRHPSFPPTTHSINDMSHPSSPIP